MNEVGKESLSSFTILESKISMESEQWEIKD